MHVMGIWGGVSSGDLGWHPALTGQQRPGPAASVVPGLQWGRDCRGTQVAGVSKHEYLGGVGNGDHLQGAPRQLCWSLVPPPVAKAAGFFCIAGPCEARLLPSCGCPKAGEAGPSRCSSFPGQGNFFSLVSSHLVLSRASSGVG